MFIKDNKHIKEVFRLAYTQAEAMINSGKQVDLEVTEHKSKRSNEQNNYYWMFCSKLSDFFNDAGLTYGEYKVPYTSDIIHDINKKLFGVKTTTKLSIKDFIEYMTKVICFWYEKTRGNFQIEETPRNYLEVRGYVELMK